jgi:hypothetical protein
MPASISVVSEYRYSNVAGVSGWSRVSRPHADITPLQSKPFSIRSGPVRRTLPQLKML